MISQRRVVGVVDARHHQHELQHGRDEERVGDAARRRSGATSAAGSRSRTMTLRAPVVHARRSPSRRRRCGTAASRRGSPSRSESSHMSTATGQQAEEVVRCCSITPFGRPVVPLEYSWNATSSARSAARGSTSAWRADPARRSPRARRGRRSRGSCRPSSRSSAMASRTGTKSGADDEHLGAGVVDDVLDLGWRRAAS